VRALSIDSASFRQLRETESSTGESVRDQIRRIVRQVMHPGNDCVGGYDETPPGCAIDQPGIVDQS